MPEASVAQWRAPVVLQVKAAVSAAAGIVIAAVFFPLWVAVPVAVLLAAWGAGMCAWRPSVLLAEGNLTVRLGPVRRRVPVSQIEAVVLDRGRVTIGKTDKTAVSFYAWRKSKLDAWLKVPDIASDVAHAVSRAATASQASTGSRAGTARVGRSAKNLPLIVMACAGVVEIAATFVTRVSWGSPVMTVLGVIVALAFGFTGMFTLVYALWTFLTAHRTGHRRPGGPASA